MNRTILHGILAFLLGAAAAAVLVISVTAAATAEPADTRTETLVQVCEPELWVSIWRDADGTLDSIGIQWPNAQYDSRTRPGPVRVNGIELDVAAYVWGESAWFTTVQDPIDADSVLIQYGTCGAMIAEDGTVVQAPALAPSTDHAYAPDVEDGTDDDEAPIVTPAPERPRSDVAGRVLKTD